VLYLFALAGTVDILDLSKDCSTSYRVPSFFLLAFGLLEFTYSKDNKPIQY
jgi:hypothetical protein